MGIQQAADFIDFLGGNLLSLEGVEDELGAGAIKKFVDHGAQNRFLDAVPGGCGEIDVGAAGLIALDEALLCHDLEQLEGGGVAGAPDLVECIADVANGRGTVTPEYMQNFELRVRWTGGWPPCHTVLSPQSSMPILCVVSI